MPDSPDHPERPDSAEDRTETSDEDRTETPDETGDLESHPGRPKDPDEVDPELVRLRRPRAKVGWLLSLTIVFFCFYVMAKLKNDLAFSWQSEEPTRIAEAGELLTAELDSYVEVHAVPDRSYLGRVLSAKADEGHRVAPVLGSGGKLWLLLPGSPWAEEPTYHEIYRGRLKALEEMPFYRPLLQWIEKQGRLPRFVKPEEAKEAIEEGARRIESPSGDAISLSGDPQVEVRELFADEALVTVAPTDEHPDEAAWRAALVRAGLLAESRGPETGDAEVGWTYRVEIDGGADAANAVLAEEGLLAGRARPALRTHRAPWSELESRRGALEMSGTAISWGTVDEISVAAPLEVPEGARIVLGTEQPARYWYVLPLFSALALFALLFLWAGVRAVRS